MNPLSKKILRLRFTLIFVVFILILSNGFHYPVQITDALTRGPAPGFTVSLSPWRILFEPFFGPLLFYLRADHALAKFSMLLVWAVLLALIVSFIQERTRRSKTRFITIGRALRRWLVSSLCILPMWAAMLLIIVFAPLPGNSIVNHHPDTILLNIHSHTEYSHDGIIPPVNLLKWHRRNGFDAFFLTEHNHHRNTLRLVTAQDSGRLMPAPLLIAGEEFSGSNHLLLLGLRRNFNTRNMADSVAIDSAHANRGVAIVAHWFSRPRNPVQFYIDRGVDGFEIVNQGEGVHYDPRLFSQIVEKCTANGLLLLAAADYHGYGSVCSVWNAIKIPGWRQMPPERLREAVLSIFRNHEQNKITVLTYNDRLYLSSGFIWLSPIFLFIAYFRSLLGWQILSWMVWLLLGRLFIQVDKKHVIRWSGSAIWMLAAFFCSVFILGMGIHLLRRARPLLGYNEIYSEYGHYFLWFGILFSLGTMAFFLWLRKRRAQ